MRPAAAPTKTPPTKPSVQPGASCAHPHLHFKAGGLYLVCCSCPRRFAAMMKDYDIPDIMARAEPIPEGTLRSDSMAPMHKEHKR